MLMVRAAAAALIFVAGVGAALAGPADVRCIQKGLQSKGFDPNGVDGVIGPDTQAAASAYLARNPSSRLPDLSAATAAKWCDAFGGKRGGTGAVTFVVRVGGVEGQDYNFHLLGPDLVTFHQVAATSGETIRVRATRDQIDNTYGYCVQLPVIAGASFRDPAGAAAKSLCVPLKGAGLSTGAVISYSTDLY